MMRKFRGLEILEIWAHSHAPWATSLGEWGRIGSTLVRNGIAMGPNGLKYGRIRSSSTFHSLSRSGGDVSGRVKFELDQHRFRIESSCIKMVSNWPDCGRISSTSIEIAGTRSHWFDLNRNSSHPVDLARPGSQLNPKRFNFRLSSVFVFCSSVCVPIIVDPWSAANSLSLPVGLVLAQ